jgi:hypothetical protein
MSWTDIAEYESIRVATDVHKLRHSHHHKLIQSGPGQTLMLATRAGYTCFRIVESGLEIPVHNVASAIPKGVSLAGKLRKTTGTRLPEKPQAKDVPRKMRGHDGEMVAQPRRAKGTRNGEV